MSVPRLRYIAITGTVTGLAVAITLYAIASGMGLAPDWIIYLWPTAIMLMATETLGRSAEAYSILALSVALNGLLYMLVAMLLWSLLWMTARATRRASRTREV
jgi:hypothetical protein